jgi:hypothetical protein
VVFFAAPARLRAVPLDAERRLVDMAIAWARGAFGVSVVSVICSGSP